jgi:hypothetical protein
VLADKPDGDRNTTFPFSVNRDSTTCARTARRSIRRSRSRRASQSPACRRSPPPDCLSCFQSAGFPSAHACKSRHRSRPEATDSLPKPEGDRQPASLRPLRGIVICAKSDFDTSDGNIPAPRPWTCFAPLIMAAVYGATNRRLTQFRQRCKRRNQSWRLRSTNPAETPIPRSKGRRG